MIFPRDQEYFKDIGSDGKLDPERFPRGQETARQVFRNYAKEHQQDTVSVHYTYSKSLGDTGASYSEMKEAIDRYETSLFNGAADAAYEHAYKEAIGAFPDGTVNAGRFSSEKNNLSETANIVVKEQLEKVQPVDIGGISKKYRRALDAKKNMGLSRVGVLFLLLHMAIVAYSALPLLPGMESRSWFGQGGDWAILLGGCLTLVIAWLFHMGTLNTWAVPGIIHLLFTGIFLGWQMADHAEPKSRLITAGIILAIGLITVIRYLIDGFGGLEKSIVREFTDWCDREAREDHRKLRFYILWYQDITGKHKTPFDDMEKEFENICDKRKKF